MPFQNRVFPTGQIAVHPARGTLTGNRGILHRPDGTLGTARWRHKAWICCTLHTTAPPHPINVGRHWTPLFFLDEATALAAGHRPCARCRAADYRRFLTAWQSAFGVRPAAPVVDATLHAARIDGAGQRRFAMPLRRVPPGAMILWHDRPHVAGVAGLQAWSPDGYRLASARMKEAEVMVLTPAPIVAVLQAGYRPALHHSCLV